MFYKEYPESEYNQDREKENRLPKPHKAHWLWEIFHNVAANSGIGEDAQRGLRMRMENYEISPELEQDIRSGKFGDRLREINLEAHARIGDLTEHEKDFIRKNSDRARGGHFGL